MYCAPPRPPPAAKPAQRHGLVRNESGGRQDRGVGTACLACPCWVGCRLAWGAACWSPSPHNSWGSWNTPAHPLLTPSSVSALKTGSGLGLWSCSWLSKCWWKSGGWSESWGRRGPLRGQEAAGGTFCVWPPVSLGGLCPPQLGALGACLTDSPGQRLRVGLCVHGAPALRAAFNRLPRWPRFFHAPSKFSALTWGLGGIHVVSQGQSLPLVKFCL